jgi:putative DNA methylase
MLDSANGGRPRLLIEEWLPAAAIGVECIRERSTGQQPPDKRLHVWWARRPLVASRAAVLASVLPSEFSRETFERLMGFWGTSEQIVNAETLLLRARDANRKIPNPHGMRAFRAPLRKRDISAAHAEAESLWGRQPVVIDPMAGGGSIPLESARLGFATIANEYNPVACSVLEATLDYPLRFGPDLADCARKWSSIWRAAFVERMARFFPAVDSPAYGKVLPLTYIFARTVPCPGTGHPTPLVPDWHLLKPKGGVPVVAVPVVNKAAGTWTVEVRPVGVGPQHVAVAPPRTYGKGKGISLFTGEPIPPEWIKAKAQAGEMGSTPYAVILKTPQGLKFRPPEQGDLDAIAAARMQLEQCRADWEARNLLPTEAIPPGSKTTEPLVRGIRKWADMFTPRQLLTFGVLMEQLQALRPQIIAKEGPERGEAVIHLMAFVIDKLANYNNILASWHISHQVIRGIFDRHDFSFKPTFTEMVPVSEGSGLSWAIENTIDAYRAISNLPNSEKVVATEINQGSATALPQISDASLEAIVVDPPYSDNVQYSELADFFYVWLKRTQGHRRPEWFSTLLCENDQEAVKNDARYRMAHDGKAKDAKIAAQAQYQHLMTEVFRECHRILRPQGALTVMFTHKKQEAWEALFDSLIVAGFTITATWPIKTESEHSLHQAKKNAAQSTVILVARKRVAGAGVGYFDAAMQHAIRTRAQDSASRLQKDGLNAVDQLVGSFGPAMEEFSRYDAVRTDTGEPVSVGNAIEIAGDAVSQWRISQLAEKGLNDVEPEARFALLCWDVLRAAEFRFNEAKLLGHAVGMDVAALEQAGLISVKQDNVRLLSAQERRRDRALSQDEAAETLFGWVPSAKKNVKRADALKVHPRDPQFRTKLDLVHALALEYLDAGGGLAGIGAAKALALRHGVQKGDAVARLMQALLNAAPEAVRRDKGPKSAAAQFPEFRAWYALLQPLFELVPPDWTEKKLDLDLVQRMHALAPEGEGEDETVEDLEDEDEQDGAPED